MAANTLKQGTAKELNKLFALLLGSIGETLGSLVNKQIVLRPIEPELKDVEALLADLPRPCAVARGALDKGFAGKQFVTLIEIPDAVAMAGLLMLTPEDVVAVRRTKGVIEAEDAAAFGELGNVLYSGLGNVLRDQLGNIDIRFQDHATVKPGSDPDGILGSEPLFVHGFRMKVGEYPESTGAVAIDRATAEAWNKGPFEQTAVESPSAPAASKDAASAPAARVDDEGLERIPAAPIRGTLAAFVLQPDAFRTLRRSCRRVGLELRRHGKGEIPNPAAHKNEVVLLDVPVGEERRFDWCRRVKEMAATTKVVVLLHQPSRQRVAQAFLSKADVILGFPCEELQLSHKLTSLLPPEAGTPPAAS